MNDHSPPVCQCQTNHQKSPKKMTIPLHSNNCPSTILSKIFSQQEGGNKANSHLSDQKHFFNASATTKSNQNENLRNDSETSDHTCLLHNKSLDLVCCTDALFICQSCAIFGKHKDHKLKYKKDMKNQLTNMSKEAVKIYEKVKSKEEDFNEEVIRQYIEDEFSAKGEAELKKIKAEFRKLIDTVRKAQKKVISQFQQYLKSKKQKMLKEISIVDLLQKRKEWYCELQKLLQTNEQADSPPQLRNCIKYVNQEYPESYILERGQYIHFLYSSEEKLIQNKIDNEVSNSQADFDHPNFQIALKEVCSFGRSARTSVKAQNEEGDSDEDNLLEDSCSIQRKEKMRASTENKKTKTIDY